MKRIKYICVVAVFIVTQLAAYASAGELSPELSMRLQATHTEDYFSVIIRMADRADLKAAVRGIVGRSKALRSRNVIKKLRSKAQETQGDVLTFLKKQVAL